MRLTKSLELALNSLVHSKLRSWLTIIGIIIGVAAVVAIVSIGEGLQQNVEQRLGDLGTDLITISPGGGKAFSGFGGRMRRDRGSGATVSSMKVKNLTKRDIQVLQAIEGIKTIQGKVSGSGEAYYLGQKTKLSIDGVDPLAWKEITTSELESGRFISGSDYNGVVVGHRIATKTFKQPLVINRVITIEGKLFKIVGILKEGGGMGSEDNKIIMNIKSARDTIASIGNEKFNSIIIKVNNPENVETIIEKIDQKLMLARHVNEKKKDYSINSAKSTQERISSITDTMTWFLGAIAAVSLLVGAVGIANTMFTSVLEKTKEIGIMKAIGAKNKDIMILFMFNSGMVGLVGGIMGIILGSIISSLIPLLGMKVMGAGGGGMNTLITGKLLLFALLISVGIGVIAGLIPAYRASKLKPVDALRY